MRRYMCMREDAYVFYSREMKEDPYKRIWIKEWLGRMGERERESEKEKPLKEYKNWK